MPIEPDDFGIPDPHIPFTGVTGVARSLSISQSAASAVIVDETDGVERAVQLWTDSDAVIPDRVTQSMWASLARESIASGKSLTCLVYGRDVSAGTVFFVALAA